MAPRRNSKPVTLTDGQRARLERLWFIQGNYGPKSTPGNHQFIQCLLEHGLDIRPLFTKRTAKKDRPTDECVAAVDKILNGNYDAQDDQTSARLLRLVESTSGQRPRLKFPPEVTSMLDEMRRHQQSRTDALDPRSDTPDAA